MGLVEQDVDALGIIESAYPPWFERAACSAIVQSVPHAVLLVDARLHIVLANRSAAALFGRNPARLLGAPLTHLLSPDAVDGLRRAFGPRKFRVVETSLPSKNRDRATTIKITAAPLSSRKVSRFTLLVVEDISDKATLEQQLVESETQAAMGRLAAGLLHEVANPLSSLGSNLSFVRSALPVDSSPEVTSALDASLDQLEQMRQLLGTLSRLPGRTDPRYELADMHQLVQQCATFIAKEAERLRIVVSVMPPADDMTCEMDVRLMKQVLINLLKNAMEATPDGGRITMRTTVVAPPGEIGGLEVEIADTGAGIAECDLRRIFRPLFSTKRRGAGLGLSFCRQAVEEHGGSIRISTAGKDLGTTVCVSLPVRQPINPDI